MRRRSTLLAGAVGAAAVAVGLAARHRRQEVLDQTEGQPLVLPPGDVFVLPTHDGGQLAVRDMGDGQRTFVLSHGWTNDARMWGAVARRLVERGHRVVVYDQRGHAGSTAGTDGLTMSAFAEDLATVVQHLGVTDVVVVGHSMGGMSAQALLVERPDVVKAHVGAVVLVATACSQVGGRFLLDGVATTVLASPVFDRALATRRVGPRMLRGTVGRSVVAAHLEAMRETLAATSAETRTGCLVAMRAMDFEEALAHVELPVHVVVGSRDLLTPRSQSRRLAEIIPGAELHVIDGAGHMLSLEAPDELTDQLERAAARIPA
ncbi:MAG: alpha/beta hydrolase [Acidimicrobiales bacterium]